MYISSQALPFTSVHSGDVHYSSTRSFRYRNGHPLQPRCILSMVVVVMVVVVMVVVVHETPFCLRALRSSSATSTSTATSSGGFAGCASVAAPFARLFRQCAVRRRSRTTCSFPPPPPVMCHVTSRGVVIARLLVPLTNDRAITER